MKHSHQIIEDETSFKVLTDGVTMLSVEYEENKKKWIISSEDKELQIYEEWNDAKEEKEKVVAAALLLAEEKTKAHLKSRRLVHVQLAGYIIISVCSAITIFNNKWLPAYVIGIEMVFLLSVTFLYQAYRERKIRYLFIYVIYVILMVLMAKATLYAFSI